MWYCCGYQLAPVTMVPSMDTRKQRISSNCCCNSSVGHSMEHISCHYDNIAIVSAINASRAKYQPINHLLQCHFFFTAHFNIAISTEHIPSLANVTADAISRTLLLTFSPQLQLSTDPTPLPSELKTILLDTTLHWSSPPIGTYCFQPVWPTPGPTLQLCLFRCSPPLLAVLLHLQHLPGIPPL